MTKATILIFISSVALFASKEYFWLRPEYIPAPKKNPLTEKKVELGKLLFFDSRLSKDNSISCATCHIPYNYWTDSRQKAVGIKGRVGKRNTPTIINSAYQALFFWDARASTLEDQALMPIENKDEMDLPLNELVKKLKSIEGYTKLFKEVFGSEGVTKQNIAKALASFERTIVSQDSPFDKWIKGNKNAISQDAIEGFEIFQNKGKCTSCHNGFNFTNYSINNIALGDDDIGAYVVNKNPLWKGSFKTPTLRNVAQTGPYFHDGSVHTLEEAVFICGNGGRYKDKKGRSPFFRDRNLDIKEVRKIVKFLETLTEKRPNFIPPQEFPR